MCELCVESVIVVPANRSRWFT